MGPWSKEQADKQTNKNNLPLTKQSAVMMNVTKLAPRKLRQADV